MLIFKSVELLQLSLLQQNVPAPIPATPALNSTQLSEQLFDIVLEMTKFVVIFY
jgi:hypothetical protein